MSDGLMATDNEDTVYATARGPAGKNYNFYFLKKQVMRIGK